GLLVVRLGGRPLLDDALDQPIADLHAQMVDGGILGQGEHVDAFRPGGAGVRELLANARPRHDAGHGDVDVGLERRGRYRCDLLGASPEQRALGDAAGLSARAGGDLRPGGRSRQGEDQTHEDRQPSNGPHELDYRSPAGEVDSAGATAASLRNSRCTRRLISWHSLPASSHSAPSWPIVVILMAGSGTPRSTRKRFTTSARRWARPRLYSADPWVSV